MARGLRMIVLVMFGNAVVAFPVYDYFERAVLPKCWYPDSSLAREFNYTPNPAITFGFATCCDQSLGDEYLEGGLCWFPSSPQRGPYIYRAACTDRSWKSDRCAQFCTENTPNFWEALVYCPKGNSFTFCCQKSAEQGSCCDDADLALTRLPKFPDHVMATLSSLAVLETATGTDFAAPSTDATGSWSTSSTTTAVDGITTSSSSITTSPLSNAQSSPPTTSAPTPTPTATASTSTTDTPSDENGGLSQEAIIGMAVGIPSLIATIVATIAVWYYKPRFVQDYVTTPTKVHVVDPIRKKWWG